MPCAAGDHSVTVLLRSVVGLTSLSKSQEEMCVCGIVASHQSQTPVFLPLPVAVAGTARMHRRERNWADWWDFQEEIFA